MGQRAQPSYGTTGHADSGSRAAREPRSLDSAPQLGDVYVCVCAKAIIPIMLKL